MRARRAVLYMPGDDERKTHKAATLDVDCVCLDLEDGVAANRKEEARAAVASALRDLDFGRSERLVRINPVGSGLEAADLAAALAPGGRPDGLVLPKVEGAGAIRWASAQIAAAEAAHGWPPGGIGLLALIETAMGVVNLAQVAGADPRLQALLFGAEDLAGDIGAVRTREAWEVFYARSAVVTHAAAFGLQAVDMVHIDFRDAPGFVEECEQAARMGYVGKQVIHPDQVGPAQAAFTPGDEAVAYALRVMKASRQRQETGYGAFALDGKMIDPAVVRSAERVLERARAAGKVA